jgi:peroxiredoxin Q/BCP
LKCLVEGDKAPDFTLHDQDGNVFKLSDLRGSYVVLYFYPKSSYIISIGCTLETIGFRNVYSELKKLNTEVVGVSSDSRSSVKVFCEKCGVPFRILSDPLGSVVKLYCARGLIGSVKRITYLIDPEGTIIKIWRRVNAIYAYLE